mgnify:FL=1
MSMRHTRRLVPGATYHVIARTNRREFLLSAPSIKDMFLGIIARAKERFTFELVSLCVMDNHIHLMLRPTHDASLSRIMQWMLSVFALRYNRLFGLHGHVWYDRFKSVVIGSLRQFVTTFNYVLDNPARAGLVSDGREYRYGPVGIIRYGPEGIIEEPSPLVRLLLAKEYG